MFFTKSFLLTGHDCWRCCWKWGPWLAPCLGPVGKWHEPFKPLRRTETTVRQNDTKNVTKRIKKQAKLQMCLTMSRSWRNAGPWLRHQRHWDVQPVDCSRGAVEAASHKVKSRDCLKTGVSFGLIPLTQTHPRSICRFPLWASFEAARGVFGLRHVCVCGALANLQVISSPNLLTWTHRWYVCLLTRLLFLRLWLRFKWLRLWRRPWHLGHGIRIANDAWSVPFLSFQRLCHRIIGPSSWLRSTVSCNGVVGWAFVNSLKCI